MEADCLIAGAVVLLLLFRVLPALCRRYAEWDLTRKGYCFERRWRFHRIAERDGEPCMWTCRICAAHRLRAEGENVA